MKTVILISSNASIIIADESQEVSVMTDHIVRGAERIYGLGDSQVVLHEDVTVPSDWESSKYCFDGMEWTLNPDWFDFRDKLLSSGSA
jgi:hypothetical protein